MIEYPKVRDLKQKRQEKDLDLGSRYLPSNGTDGDFFRASQCYSGCRFWVFRKSEDQSVCSKDIDLVAYMATHGDRSTWPKQWRETPEGPVCTARRERVGRGRDDRAEYERAMRER